MLQVQAFFTIILGAFVFGERLQGKQLAGISLAVFGVLVLIEGSLNGQHVALLGFMLTPAAGLSWACGNIFNKLIMQHEARPAVLSLVVWSALIPIVPFMAASFILEGPQAMLKKPGGNRPDDYFVANLPGVRCLNHWLWYLGIAARTL